MCSIICVCVHNSAVHNSAGDRIKSVTNNVRLGIGAFNDKPALPFQREPLDASVPFATFLDTFAFRHIVNLTNDIGAFSVSYIFNTVGRV